MEAEAQEWYSGQKVGVVVLGRNNYRAEDRRFEDEAVVRRTLS